MGWVLAWRSLSRTDLHKRTWPSSKFDKWKNWSANHLKPGSPWCHEMCIWIYDQEIIHKFVIFMRWIHVWIMHSSHSVACQNVLLCGRAKTAAAVKPVMVHTKIQFSLSCKGCRNTHTDPVQQRPGDLDWTVCLQAFRLIVWNHKFSMNSDTWIEI